MDSHEGKISCVIFDVDGTLVRTIDLILASFNHLMRRYLGKTLPPEEIIALFGPPEEGAIAAMFGPDRVGELMDELCEFYRANHGSMVEVHAGIEQLLQFLKGRGVHLAVFTGKGSRTTTITMEAAGLQQYFQLIVSGNDVKRHKPDPEGILKVLTTFHVSPGEALMVGDSLADISAARGAGVRVASVLWDSYDSERVLRAGADYVFHNVDEMFRWIRTRIR